MQQKEGDSLTLTVRRSGGDGSGQMEFRVPLASPYSRILDALLYVRQHLDHTLAFRYACRVGMCGSCAMVINGKEGLACQTTCSSLAGGRVTLEPLRALPVQKDLMVDMAPFFHALKKAQAAFRPSKPTQKSISRIVPSSKNRRLIEAQTGCITCGACFSACEWSTTRRGYLGPAALNRIFMLCLDERDALGKQRLATAAQDTGVLRCHAVGSCAEVCPVGVPLRTGLHRLKQLSWKHVK